MLPKIKANAFVGSNKKKKLVHEKEPHYDHFCEMSLKTENKLSGLSYPSSHNFHLTHWLSPTVKIRNKGRFMIVSFLSEKMSGGNKKFKWKSFVVSVVRLLMQ